MGGTIVAVLHFGLFAGLIGYGIVLCARGETDRGLMILGIMGVYYALVLHKAVQTEIKRKRRLKNEKRSLK